METKLTQEVISGGTERELESETGRRGKHRSLLIIGRLLWETDPTPPGDPMRDGEIPQDYPANEVRRLGYLPTQIPGGLRLVVNWVLTPDVSSLPCALSFGQTEYSDRWM